MLRRLRPGKTFSSLNGQGEGFFRYLNHKSHIPYDITSMSSVQVMMWTVPAVTHAAPGLDWDGTVARWTSRRGLQRAAGSDVGRSPR